LRILGAWTGSIADFNSITRNKIEVIREALQVVMEIPDTSSYKAMTSEATDIISNSSILWVVENAGSSPLRRADGLSRGNPSVFNNPVKRQVHWKIIINEAYSA